MSKTKKNSVYALRKSNMYLRYVDDEQCKDVGPNMIILKDEFDDDKIDSPFPTAFSPTTASKTDFSFDIDISLNSDKQQETTSETADVYAQVIPKSQRRMTDKGQKKDLKANKEAHIGNGEIAVTVDPHAQYTKVQPRVQRIKASEERRAYANNRLSREVPQEKSKSEARAKVLSAIGSKPMAIQSDDNGITYRKNIPTAQRIESALGNTNSRESTEL